MDLDDPRLYRRLDRHGMGDLIDRLPAQCREAWQRGLAFPLPEHLRSAQKVVVVGMGGSAIAADLAADLQSFERAVPIIVHREYSASPWVDRNTLVVASSLSGETEETLAAFQEAIDRGAMALVMTAGGKLAARARSGGAPLFPIEHPGPARTALGHTLFPLLAFLQRLGLAPDRSEAAEQAFREMERLGGALRVAVPETGNPAKQLARRIGGRIALICSAQHLLSCGRRWKAQLNENSKAPAFVEALPEAHHNAIEGLQAAGEACRNIFAVLLRGDVYDARVSRRFGLTIEALDQASVPCHTFDAPGKSALAQMMTSVIMGDYCSYYLAMLREIDPTPLPTIEWIKGRMAQG